MSKRKIRHSGPLLPRTEESCDGSGQIFDEETRKRGVGLDGCPLLTTPHGENKPTILMRLELDYNVPTSVFMLKFSKIAGLSGYFELKLREPIFVFDDPIKSIDCIVVTNSTEDYPDGNSITLTNLKTTRGSCYSKFESFITNELLNAQIQRGQYVQFEKGFWLRARTEGNGRTGDYQIVGSDVAC